MLIGLHGGDDGLRLDLCCSGHHITPNNDFLYLQHFHADAFTHTPPHTWSLCFVSLGTCALQGSVGGGIYD